MQGEDKIMATITFDTHKFITRLKAAGLSEQQAVEVVAVVAESHDSFETATKGDLREMELRQDARFDARISEAKADIIKWVVGLIFMQTGVIAALMMKLAK